MVMMWRLRGYDVAGGSGVIVSGWEKIHLKNVTGGI